MTVHFRYQTPGTIVFSWDPPGNEKKNGDIINYEVEFNKNVVLNTDFKHMKNTTEGRIVFDGLEENMDYTFKVIEDF